MKVLHAFAYIGMAFAAWAVIEGVVGFILCACNYVASIL